jgi:hypothetical protein
VEEVKILKKRFSRRSNTSGSKKSLVKAIKAMKKCGMVAAKI